MEMSRLSPAVAGDWAGPWRWAETNVNGPFCMARAVVPGMIARRWSSVNRGCLSSSLPSSWSYSIASS
jgi:NADP-dependent 3-hydroxy acid dehydrogenase YdfG